MKQKTTIAIAAGALVMGLVLGAVGIASGQPAGEDTDATVAALGSPGRSPGRMMGSMLAGEGASLIEVTAGLTGLSTDDILVEMRDEHRSLLAVAEDHGVTADEITVAFIDANEEALAELVDDSRITQEQADWALGNLSDHAEDIVLSAGMGGPGPFAGPGRDRGPRSGVDGGGACWHAPPAVEAPSS